MKNFEEDGFYNLKYVDDKICGMQDYLYTTAIVVGISELDMLGDTAIQNLKML